jgi:hypothetical protein
MFGFIFREVLTADPKQKVFPPLINLLLLLFMLIVHINILVNTRGIGGETDRRGTCLASNGTGLRLVRRGDRGSLGRRSGNTWLKKGPLPVSSLTISFTEISLQLHGDIIKHIPSAAKRTEHDTKVTITETKLLMTEDTDR